ncbi:MAG TPA: ABC transporter permease [Cyclobacteriaceae bacterium]
MIIEIAWKNVWRTKKRSLAVIGAIAVGSWALIFMFSFLNSFNETYIEHAVKYEYSHIQIHDPKFRPEPELKNYIRNFKEVSSQINQLDKVQAYSRRVIVNGMIASSRATQGIQITGIEPQQEAGVTTLDQFVDDGSYFQKIDRNPIMISKKIADKLGAKVRSKVVLTFQDKDRNLTAGAFRIEGIFNSKSSRVNESIVYVRDRDIQKLIQLDQYHEIALVLNDIEEVPAVQGILKKKHKDLLIQSFSERAPEFNLLKQQSQVSKQMLTTIIMLALLFGIINTMLMAVLERTKEIGMLRAIGMGKESVFKLFVVETIMLSIVGGPVGLLLGMLTNTYFSTHGLNLSRYSQSLQALGFDTVFYPILDNLYYPLLMMVVIITALIGSLYPAYKAIQLKPVEALRKI